MATWRHLEFWLMLSVLVGVGQDCAAQLMATNGRYSTTPTGAAQYTIDIEVPPGPAGMTPSISLVYNSQQNGLGYLGMGWSMTGLSSISRCSPTIAQDGVRGRVTYTSADRFCLDGERLIAVSGAYGVSGTEYRTERDNFSRIVQTGSGPNSFAVQTKSGLTMEYGTTVDSRVLSAAPSGGFRGPRAWALHRVLNAAGSYMLISYSNISYANKTVSSDAAVDDGVFYPTRIDYSGVPADANSTRTVFFDWTSRTDKGLQYEGGVPYSSDRVLQGLKMVAGPNFVRSYRLGYDTTDATYGVPSPWRVRPHLTSVYKCDDMTCFPPVVFSWQQSPGFDLTFQGWANDSAFPGLRTDYEQYFADLNGDGTKSWIQVSHGTDEAWVGHVGADGKMTGASWTRLPLGVGSADTFEHFFADVDGDGKDDWVRVSRTTNEAWVALGAGNGNFQFWTQYSSAVGSANTYAHFFADIDGDGKADMIQVGRTIDDASVALATGGGNFQFWSSHLTSGVALSNADSYFVDANGDGKVDWIQVPRTAGPSIVVRTSSGNGNFVSSTVSPPVWKGTPNPPGWGYANGGKTMFADVNGDGIPDLIQIYSGAISVALGDGNGQFSLWSMPQATYPWASTDDYIVDIDGKGLADWISITNDPQFGTDGALTIQAWDGAGAFYNGNPQLYKATSNLGSTHDYRLYFADLNGDGRPDWIRVNRLTGKASIAMANQVGADFITSITNGIDTPIVIDYKRLNDPTVYTPDGNGGYPVRDVQGLQAGNLDAYRRKAQALTYLVASVTTPNAVGGSLHTTYSYGGLKKDLSGRGLLGFRWLQSLQTESGRASRSEFRQDWPYVGMVANSKSTVAGGGNNGVLSETVNSFDCTDFVSASGCTSAIGRRYFVYTNQSVSSSWDLNGVALPSSSATMQYDSFGNATRVVNSTSDGDTKTTDSVFMNDTSKWWIGRPTRVTVTNSTQ